jgi:hypothetical protein
MKNLSDDQTRRSRQPAQELPTSSTPKLMRALLLWIKKKKRFDAGTKSNDEEE